MKELNFKEWILNQKDGALKIDKTLLLEHLRKTNINEIDESKIDSNKVKEMIRRNEALEPIVIDRNFNVIDGLYRLLAYEKVEEIKEIEVVLGG